MSILGRKGDEKRESKRHEMAEEGAVVVRWPTVAFDQKVAAAIIVERKKNKERMLKGIFLEV